MGRIHVFRCRYSFEGVLQAIYGYDRDTLECNADYCHFREPKDVLEELDVADAKFYVDFAVLVGYFVILRGLCYLVLRYRLKSQR